MDFNNPVLARYLEYVEDTESPRIFHIAALLSGVSASLGRRCWFPFGHTRIFPNIYMLLVGPPAVRKSTAINLAADLIRNHTGVQFAPSDTGGARQGLIVAMRGEATNEEDQELEDILRGIDIAEVTPDSIKQLEVNTADAHTMYACASEFSTFIGDNSRNMVVFLTKMFDGEPYDYQIKSEFYTLREALLSVLGGTTPTEIAAALPPSAVGGGFTSRFIFVYANKKYKKVARPKVLDPKIRDDITSTLTWIDQHISGPFEITPQADEYLTRLYDYQVDIQDARFMYYIERRYTHLIKMMMAVTALRKTHTVNLDDVKTAHEILKAMESNMVEALGEYGLSPLGAAKQRMLEFIQNNKGRPVPATIIHTLMSRDMRVVDIENSLIDLQNAGKIKRINPEKLGLSYVYLDDRDQMRDLVNGLLTAEVVV